MSNIVYNSGVNNTLYYNILEYFKTIMENHPSIASVELGDITELDAVEFPAYPIGNLTILGCDFTTNTTEWTVQLIVADKIKNKNNESEPRTNEIAVPFYGPDDVVDIHANTLAIINDLTSFTQMSVEGFQIIETITNIPFEERFNNGLGGWVSTFTLITHNDRPRCLYNLYPVND
jgi:hypothetical protein